MDQICVRKGTRQYHSHLTSQDNNLDGTALALYTKIQIM